MFGRDGIPAPQLPPLDTDSTPLKAKKGSKIPTPKKKTPMTEKVAQSARSAAGSTDSTPSKAEKVLGQKTGPGEALRVKEVEIVNKKQAKKTSRKSRIPSLFRSLGLSGVKDEEYCDAVPNRPLLTTTPSPTRSKFPKILAQYDFVHVSRHGDGHGNGQDSQPDASMDRSLRTTHDSEPPSPSHTPRTLSSISESDDTPLSSISGINSTRPKFARNETRTYNTPAVFRAADFDFSNEDSGKAEVFKSRSKIPRSPGSGSSTTPVRRQESISELNFSTPSRLPLARKLYVEKATEDVQAMKATPQHRSTLPTIGKSNTSNIS